MGPDIATGTGLRCPSVLFMLQGTFCRKLPCGVKTCGGAGTDCKCDPDASGNGRECGWALHGDEHLRCCRTVMGSCAVLEQASRPGDEHLVGWHTAGGGDQSVAEPVLTRAELGVF